MREWRPSDWEETKFKNLFGMLPRDGTYPHPYDVYEIAADAIVAGIWKMAKESATGTFVFDTHYFGNHAVVFLKDEETLETP